jgi:hypothetical protein
MLLASATAFTVTNVGQSPYPARGPQIPYCATRNVGYRIDIRKPEVNDRLRRSLGSQRGGCRCDLFVHDGPSRCVLVVLVQFRRSLT